MSKLKSLLDKMIIKEMKNQLKEENVRDLGSVATDWVRLMQRGGKIQKMKQIN